jgi:hypothetical protein
VLNLGGDRSMRQSGLVVELHSSMRRMCARPLLRDRFRQWTVGPTRIVFGRWRKHPLAGNGMRAESRETACGPKRSG